MIRNAVAEAALMLAVVALAVALVLVPLAMTQSDPWGLVTTFLFGPFESIRHTGNIVELATPSMFCGLAVALILRAGMFNLGVEGAFFLGGLGTVAATLVLPLPGVLLAPTALLLGAVAGSSVCVVPGVLRARYGASELVSSLMLNFAALFVGLYVLNVLLRDPAAGAMVSYRIPDISKLPVLVKGTRIHLGTLVALLACGLGTVYLFRTAGGFDSRIVGTNPHFAAHLGLDVARIALQAQVLGGLLAALGGGIEMLGLYQRFSWQALPGNGWTGVTVAILARSHPALVVPAALFLGWLQVGGDLVARNFSVPNEAVGLIQALLLVAVTAAALTRNPRLLQAFGARPLEGAK
ncbi:MAG: ABC transporter permease [Devosia sp.]|nr:ABC transporter permease [Devosia sp.]